MRIPALVASVRDPEPPERPPRCPPSTPAAQPPALCLADRLEANAILDRLVADEPTFPAEGARRLIALVPLRGPRRFTLDLGLHRPGTTTRNRAAGHGDVELEEPRETKTRSSDPARALEIGGYAVAHVPGSS
ncbi:hypothetical protein FF100_24485 [Methylobacterium terricola]|uniref:Uncharacterized protein n=1 Tax=Methylobacterium terricola TaxID=2583531 RepID=A0A5C4LB00_9HYPH|nr:hypothetical protein [Methylobacterium terricola]TNC10070.1 hypothetical protein FF100_24485 [Methylobacterium terricola]